MGALYVDGKKIVGAGTYHNVTSLKTGFSFVTGGYANWVVMNGVCFVTLWGVTASQTGVHEVFDGLPVGAFNGAVYTKTCRIYNSGYSLYVSCSSSETVYATLIYPVPDGAPV